MSKVQKDHTLEFPSPILEKKMRHEQTFTFRPSVYFDGAKFVHASGHHVPLDEQIRDAARSEVACNVGDDDIEIYTAKPVGESMALCGINGRERVALEYLVTFGWSEES